MFIYGITQNNFKDIQYAIKLLAQFNIVSIKRQCIICITITRYFILPLHAILYLANRAAEKAFSYSL